MSPRHLKLEVDMDVCAHTTLSPTFPIQRNPKEGHHHGYQAAASLVPREGELPSGQGVEKEK